MHATPPAAHLDVHLDDPRGPCADLAGPLLGAVSYEREPAVAAGELGVSIPLERLGAGPATETWSLKDTGTVERGALGSVRVARGGEVLFGYLRHPLAPAGLERASLVAYRDLLAAITAAGCPHLLRVWACVPGINRDEAGLERYQAFCRARAEAFEEAWGSGFTGRLPASTAVGSDPGVDELVVHFLAAAKAGVHLENPRQVAAYRYPDRYGPRSPSFARATVAPAEAGGLLFVSGTASIVGHESVHSGLEAQTHETVRNLERVREAAGGRFEWSHLKVYLRDRSYQPVARELLAAAVPGAVPALFLHADICRRELLIEIEAVARPA